VLATNEAGIPGTYTKPNTEKTPLPDLGNPRILVVEGPGPLNASVTSKIELPRTINYVGRVQLLSAAGISSQGVGDWQGREDPGRLERA
jgi:hypothetical protein